MPIKVILKDNDTGLTGCGNIDADWVLKGIKYAADNGADIINLSLICQPTDSGQVSKWQEAVDYAYGKGVVIVAGAGNHDEDLDQVLPPVPVGLNHVIAVGATNIYDERCDRDNICEYDSGHGSKLDVMAPGMSIATTTPVTLVNSSCPISINEDDAYTLGDFGGTSAATPFVSGLAALMLSANPNLRDHPDQVEYIIQRTAFDLGVPGRDEEYGYGRIDAYKAVYRAATCAQGAWPGDANKDCMVDGIDYVIWWNHYGQWTPNGPADGDFDYSGFVDDADYQIWLENYNG